MRKRLYLGCDVGGTASCAVLVDEYAEYVNALNGGPGNPHVVGFDRSAETVTSLLRAVLGENTSQLAAIAVCISGGESDPLRKKYASFFREQLRLPCTVRVIVVHDAITPLGLIIPPALNRSASGQKTATCSQYVSLVAGTGSVAAAYVVRNTKRGPITDEDVGGDNFSIEMTRRCGGWGPILGDSGSAYAIAVRALNISLRIMDGMIQTCQGPSSYSSHRRELFRECDEAKLRSLAHSVLDIAIKHYLPREAWTSEENFESNLNELVSFLYDRNTTRGQIASFAAQVSRLAKSGHHICLQVFREAGEELGHLVIGALSRRLTPNPSPENSAARVCCIGGVLAALYEVPAFCQSFRDAVNNVINEGVQFYVLDREWLCNHQSKAIAFACAHLAALSMTRSNDHWQTQLDKYVEKLF